MARRHTICGVSQQAGLSEPYGRNIPRVDRPEGSAAHTGTNARAKRSVKPCGTNVEVVAWEGKQEKPAIALFSLCSSCDGCR